MSDTSAKGPASYFPSIEKKYGRPISEWKDVVRAALPAKHMELVALLKEQHGMGQAMPTRSWRTRLRSAEASHRAGRHSLAPIHHSSESRNLFSVTASCDGYLRE